MTDKERIKELLSELRETGYISDDKLFELFELVPTFTGIIKEEKEFISDCIISLVENGDITQHMSYYIDEEAFLNDLKYDVVMEVSKGYCVFEWDLESIFEEYEV